MPVRRRSCFFDGKSDVVEVCAELQVGIRICIYHFSIKLFILALVEIKGHSLIGFSFRIRPIKITFFFVITSVLFSALAIKFELLFIPGMFFHVSKGFLIGFCPKSSVFLT
jgi:hypothetical protein